MKSIWKPQSGTCTVSGPADPACVQLSLKLLAQSNSVCGKPLLLGGA